MRVFDTGGRNFVAKPTVGFDRWPTYSRFSEAATELAVHRDRVVSCITFLDTAIREMSYVRGLRELRALI